ncbi:MAG: cupredoxin domain-containing protein [Betaproteobacteria bacterium]
MKTGTLATVSVLAAALIAGAASYVAVQMKQHVIRLSVKRFEYSPNEIVLRKGVPVVIEVESVDVVHGFNAPDLGVRTDVIPGKVARISVTPQKTGRFTFHCDVFCGTGHEDLSGTIVVKE